MSVTMISVNMLIKQWQNELISMKIKMLPYIQVYFRRLLSSRTDPRYAERKKKILC